MSNPATILHLRGYRAPLTVLEAPSSFTQRARGGFPVRGMPPGGNLIEANTKEYGRVSIGTTQIILISLSAEHCVHGEPLSPECRLCREGTP